MFVLLFNTLSGLEGCLISPTAVAGEGHDEDEQPGTWALVGFSCHCYFPPEKKRQAGKRESTCVCFLCKPRDRRQTVNYTWNMLVAEGIKDSVTRVRRSDCLQAPRRTVALRKDSSEYGEKTNPL